MCSRCYSYNALFRYSGSYLFTAIERAGAVTRPLECVAVYVHIPFCRTRCHYCAFYLETGFSPRVLRETLSAIIAEAGEWMRRLGYPRIRTVYIGGGTPSVIPPDQLEVFLTQLFKTLGLAMHEEAPEMPGTVPDDTRTPAPEEVTIEANPESVTDMFLDALQRTGVDRISLGVQSLCDRDLALLGRRSDASTAREAIRCLERSWHGRWSADLIVGTPGQDTDDLSTQIDELSDRGVEHLSLYGLTVEPHTALEQAVRRRSLRMPDRETHETLWIAARQSAVRRGFRQYEVSNFALPGAESQHNRVYWRLDPYLGLGPGAVSTLPCTVSGRPRALRLTAGSVFSYQSIHRGTLTHEIELLDNVSFLFEHFMNGLRTAEGVSMERIAKRFGIDSALLCTHLRRYWRGYSQRDRRADPSRTLRLRDGAREIVDSYLAELLGTLEKWGAAQRLELSWPAPSHRDESCRFAGVGAVERTR